MVYNHTTPTYMVPDIKVGERGKLTSHITWYTIALIILLALAADIAVAVLIWCIAHGQHEVITWHLGANNMVSLACQ